MSTPATTVEEFLKKSGWSCLKLSRESGVHFSTLYKVRSGTRKRFSPSAATQLHKVNPKLLPLEALLGLSKGSLAA